MWLSTGAWCAQFISNPLRRVTRSAARVAGARVANAARTATGMKRTLRIVTRNSNSISLLLDLSLSCSKNLGQGGFQHHRDSVLVVGRGLLPSAHFGHGAQLGGGIAHQDGLSSPLQHIHIVPIISDGHGLFAVTPEACSEPLQRPA